MHLTVVFIFALVAILVTVTPSASQNTLAAQFTSELVRPADQGATHHSRQVHVELARHNDTSGTGTALLVRSINAVGIVVALSVASDALPVGTHPFIRVASAVGHVAHDVRRQRSALAERSEVGSVNTVFLV